MFDDFWAPNVADKPAERTPYSILRDQAAAPSKKTKDVVQGEVKTDQIGERIGYRVVDLRLGSWPSGSDSADHLGERPRLPGNPFGKYVAKFATCEKMKRTLFEKLKATLGSRKSPRLSSNSMRTAKRAACNSSSLKTAR